MKTPPEARQGGVMAALRASWRALVTEIEAAYPPAPALEEVLRRADGGTPDGSARGREGSGD